MEFPKINTIIFSIKMWRYSFVMQEIIFQKSINKKLLHDEYRSLLII